MTKPSMRKLHETGLMFRASAGQLRAMMAAGHIPPARVSA